MPKPRGYIPRKDRIQTPPPVEQGRNNERSIYRTTRAAALAAIVTSLVITGNEALRHEHLPVPPSAAPAEEPHSATAPKTEHQPQQESDVADANLNVGPVTPAVATETSPVDYQIKERQRPSFTVVLTHLQLKPHHKGAVQHRINRPDRQPIKPDKPPAIKEPVVPVRAPEVKQVDNIPAVQVSPAVTEQTRPPAHEHTAPPAPVSRPKQPAYTPPPKHTHQEHAKIPEIVPPQSSPQQPAEDLPAASVSPAQVESAPPVGARPPLVHTPPAHPPKGHPVVVPPEVHTPVVHPPETHVNNGKSPDKQDKSVPVIPVHNNPAEAAPPHAAHNPPASPAGRPANKPPSAPHPSNKQHPVPPANKGGNGNGNGNKHK
jgi:hypothetical protein